MAIYLFISKYLLGIKLVYCLKHEARKKSNFPKPLRGINKNNKLLAQGYYFYNIIYTQYATQKNSEHPSNTLYNFVPYCRMYDISCRWKLKRMQTLLLVCGNTCF